LAILVLTLASLLFYGWWKWEYVILLSASIIVNYGTGIALTKRKSKLLLSFGISFNLILLGYYKYLDFFIGSVNFSLDKSLSLWGIALPLAISFYTFQQIAYLIDVYRGLAKETKFLNYALFICFFPQFIAGPIVHHSETIPQFLKKEFPRWSTRDLLIGATLFLIGFNKKVVIADSIAVIANQVFDNALTHPPTLFEAWVGAFAYSFQIYFDFSGYSDMAIGLARMFGIKLPINFNSPYKSVNVIEFWRCWHMTLSRFLRNYLYIPLGGNRHGPARHFCNILTVMLLGGLWHGAGWNFVIWGGLHGFYLVINHAWRVIRGNLGHYPNKQNGIVILLSRLATFVAVTVAWVFFRAENLDVSWSMLRGMGGANGLALPPQLLTELGNFGVWLSQAGVASGGVPVLDGTNVSCLFILLGIVWLLPNSHELLWRHRPALNFPIKENLKSIRGLIRKNKLSAILFSIERWQSYTLVCFFSGTITLGVLLTLARGKMSTEFIYFIF